MARLDDVIAALVTLCGSATGKTTYDGPPMTNAVEDDLVLVGHDGSPDSDAEPGYEQAWVDLACTRREETGQVPCAVICQGGDTDPAVGRARAGAVLAAIEAALLADMTLTGQVYSAQLASGRARLGQTERGAAVVLPFVITYRAAA